MYNSELPFILILIKKDEILLRNPLELLLYDHELILDENKIRGDNDHKHLQMTQLSKLGEEDKGNYK